MVVGVKTAFIIFSPRDLDYVKKCFDQVKIDKFWIKHYRDEEAVKIANSIIKNTFYSYYILSADDITFNPEIIDYLIDDAETYNVVTAYCQINPQHEVLQKISNVSKAPLNIKNNVLRLEDYNFYTIDELKQFKTNIIKTYFCGFCPTIIKRELLLRFPLHVNENTKSQFDAMFCLDLYRNGIDMYADLRCFTLHHANTRYLVNYSNPHGIYEVYI